MITQVNEVSNNHKFIDTQNIINKKAKVLTRKYKQELKDILNLKNITKALEMDISYNLKLLDEKVEEMTYLGCDENLSTCESDRKENNSIKLDKFSKSDKNVLLNEKLSYSLNLDKEIKNLNKVLELYLEEELKIKANKSLENISLANKIQEKEDSSLLSLFTSCNSRTKLKAKVVEEKNTSKEKEDDSTCISF